MSFLPLLLQSSGLDSLNTAQNNAGVSDMTQDVKIWDLIVGIDPVTGDISLTNVLVMSLLFALSVISIYIFVERLLSINKSLKEEKNFMHRVKEYLIDGKVDQARDLCAKTDNPAARMVEKGISRIGKPMRDIVSSIENVGKLEIYHLERRLSFLATAAGAAPMLGFLGTTLGMVRTFHAMRFEATIKLQTISGGIMEAMVTTVAGLVVGIIAYMSYNYLVAKVDKVIHHMESSSIEFLDLLNEPGK